MADLEVLDILLYGEPIGVVTHLSGDTNIFTFNQDYIDNENRPTFSLSFKDQMGELITEPQKTRTKLPPFFSNLLPEGHMRDYLAAQAGVDPHREFFLLAALGKDLPGAISVKRKSPFRWDEQQLGKPAQLVDETHILRFSLAGLQLKFSALWENDGGLTIPVDGIGGSWIVKLPSAVYAHVPENEFTMMEMAREIGIDVPETALVPVEQIKGIPSGVGAIANQAFLIKRFDRAHNEEIHIEDFAQIFGVFPDKKYRSASYRNIAQVIWAETGEEGMIEFIRRFVFNALIGNGDMHLKNWSLIYKDKTHPTLAPAYDFVSTIPYIPNDQLALTFVDSKAFDSLSYQQFSRFSSKAGLSETLVLDTVNETVSRFRKVWKSHSNFPLDKKMVHTIDTHLSSIPIWNE